MSKDNPTTAERIAAAKERFLRRVAKHAPHRAPQPTDDFSTGE